MKRQPKDVELDGVIKAYCVKCKKKNVAITDPILTHAKVREAWKPMVQGVHAKCGTKMTKFVSQDFVTEVME